MRNYRPGPPDTDPRYRGNPQRLPARSSPGTRDQCTDSTPQKQNETSKTCIVYLCHTCIYKKQFNTVCKLNTLSLRKYLALQHYDFIDKLKIVEE